MSPSLSSITRGHNLLWLLRLGRATGQNTVEARKETGQQVGKANNSGHAVPGPHKSLSWSCPVLVDMPLPSHLSPPPLLPSCLSGPVHSFPTALPVSRTFHDRQLFLCTVGRVITGHSSDYVTSLLQTLWCFASRCQAWQRSLTL